MKCKLLLIIMSTEIFYPVAEDHVNKMICNIDERVQCAA